METGGERHECSVVIRHHEHFSSSTGSQKEPDVEDKEETGDRLGERLLSGGQLRYLGGRFSRNSSHSFLLSVSSGSWR